MVLAGTKRERLLDWIRNGDPHDVPVVTLSPFAVTASYLGKEERDVTMDETVKIAEKTGTHGMVMIGAPTPFDIIPFLPNIKMIEQNVILEDGTPRRTREIKTPEGGLREIFEVPKVIGAHRREFYVKGEKELPAFACLIRAATGEIQKNAAARRAIAEKLKTEARKIGGAFPAYLRVNCPTFELMCAYYMDQATALYAIYDHQDLMEELTECYWRMTQVWLELGVEAGVDIYQSGINGLEWLSPALYERYMIAQTRRLSEFAVAHDKLLLLHTCGKLKKLAEMNVYPRMKLQMFESLSAPPTGDITDLAETRRLIGPEIVTRGGINVEYFYDDTPEQFAKRAEDVLDSVRGYKHMIGDTNDSIPAYPWKNVQALIDVVRRRKCLFE